MVKWIDKGTVPFSGWSIDTAGPFPLDEEGNRYIDLGTGIAVVGTGHNHPKVVAAVKAQLERFSHTCFQVAPYDVYVKLAERLNRAAPGATPKKTIFINTGAEAVENSIKIARKL